jgi:DNA processing protein
MAPRSAHLSLCSAPSRLARCDPDWPRLLRDLGDEAPDSLFVAGTVPSLDGAVAVVGTRYADEDALGFANELAAGLALAGHTVISGGAEGIDAAAHRGCLEAGGRTVAVLATGLVRAYPAHHAGLFGEIAASGALLCEELDPRWVRGWSFLRRNRLIAALAERVIVVQAPARSGALSTARWARTLGRQLYVVPAAPWDLRGQGCLEFLRSGDAQICTSATDVLSVPASEGSPGAGSARRARPEEIKDVNDLSEPARALWEQLRRGPRCPDELSVCLDMPAATVQEGLLTLLLVGRVRRRADGTYEKTTRSPVRD